MNNTIFSANRFGKVIKNDVVRYLPKYYGGLLVFLAILPVTAFLNIFLGSSPVSVNTRMIILFITTFCAAFAAPFVIYKNANHKKGGIDYTMLPASSLEKFLSMLLLATIALPIALLVAQLVIDTIIALILPGVFQNTVFSQELFSIENLKNFGQLILFQCFALAGNMVFRKHKFSKTIICLISFLMIVSAITSAILLSAIRNSKYAAEYLEATSVAPQDTTNAINMDTTKIMTGKEEIEIIRNYSTSGAQETVTVTKQGKRYVLNSGLQEMLAKYDKPIQVTADVGMYVILPLLMYLLTFFRIKRQQL